MCGARGACAAQLRINQGVNTGQRARRKLYLTSVKPPTGRETLVRRLQLAWGRPEGHRGWGGAFTLTGSPVLTASALALGRSRRPGGGGADVVSGTSCSLLPAGPWGVVRWGVRRVCGFATGVVARGGAGVGARSERAAALLRGRFGSCSPVSVSSVRCLCCRDALRASGYLACLVWSRLTN